MKVEPVDFEDIDLKQFFRSEQRKPFILRCITIYADPTASK